MPGFEWMSCHHGRLDLLNGIQEFKKNMAVNKSPKPAKADGLGRPTTKSAETRSRIVQGALDALGRFGLYETTTRRIATEAGVRLATLHYHFSNKEAVLLAVLDLFASDMTTILDANARDALSLNERIEAALRANWDYVQSSRVRQIVQYELTLYALRTQGSEWLAKRQYDAYIDAFASLLCPVNDLGTNPAREHADELARMMLAGIDGLILQSLADATQIHLATGLDILINAVQMRAEVLGCNQGKGSLLTCDLLK